jgi:hypothetical protein
MPAAVTASAVLPACQLAMIITVPSFGNRAQIHVGNGKVKNTKQLKVT